MRHTPWGTPVHQCNAAYMLWYGNMWECSLEIDQWYGMTVGSNQLTLHQTIRCALGLFSYQLLNSKNANITQLWEVDMSFQVFHLPGSNHSILDHSLWIDAGLDRTLHWLTWNLAGGMNESNGVVSQQSRQLTRWTKIEWSWKNVVISHHLEAKRVTKRGVVLLWLFPILRIEEKVCCSMV